MDSSRVQGRGLISSALPFLLLDFTGDSNHSVFVWHTKSGIVVLTVYVDDILLTGSDPCFKYRPIRPRYRPISPFLPAADMIWGNRSPYRLQQKTADI